VEVCLCAVTTTYHKGHSKFADGNVFGRIGLRTIRIDSTTLVEQIFDDVHTAYYDDRSAANHDAVDGSILLGPFGELKVFVFARDLARCQSCPSAQNRPRT
jgi:hypothetical protein